MSIKSNIIETQNNVHMHFFSSVSSTMDVARDISKSTCPNHTVIIAKHQECGRGRLKRQWLSDDGGIYMTWITRPKFAIEHCFAYTFSTALTIVHTLNQLFQIKAHVKWPNDVLVDSRKIAGVLTEMQLANNQFQYLNIGIGINVNNQTNTDAFSAISIHDILKKQVDKNLMIQQLCNNLATQFAHIHVDRVLESWKKHNCTIGKKVRIVLQDRTIEGQAININENGALIVKQNNGQQEAITYGDCIIPGFKMSPL